MPRDYWNTLRQVLKVGKRKKSLTVAAGEYNCGPVRGSLYAVSNTSPLQHFANDIALSTTTVTIDFWLRPQQLPASLGWEFFRFNSAGGDRIRLFTNYVSSPNNFIFEIIHSGGTTTLTYPVSFNQWHRYTIAFSSTLGSVYLYVDGVLVDSDTIAAFANANFNFIMGSAINAAAYTGHIGELALYNVYKDAIAVSQLSSFKANIGAYGTGLVAYWPMRDTVNPLVGAYVLTVGSDYTFVTDEYPPIKYGASFVAAQYNVNLSKTVSLKFPNTPPEGTTGELIVRWTDANDVIQRRKLWRVTGVDVEAEDYKGEPILAPFVLELWNIDGQETTEIPEDMILYVSDTTNPTTSNDTTSQSAATVTADSTLAAPFPITFPLTFNTQQTY